MKTRKNNLRRKLLKENLSREKGSSSHLPGMEHTGKGCRGKIGSENGGSRLVIIVAAFLIMATALAIFFFLNRRQPDNIDGPSADIASSELSEEAPAFDLSEPRGNSIGNIINRAWLAREGDWVFISTLSLGEDGYIHPLFRVAAEGVWKEEGHYGDDYLTLARDISGVNVSDGWVYYSDWDDEISLYKIRVDGSDETKLNSDPSHFVNVMGDKIYYLNGDDNNSIYSIDIDGQNRTKLNDYSCNYLFASGGWLYYSNINDGGNMYRIRYDGTNEKKINDHRSAYPNLSGEWLYYTNLDDEGKIYKIRTDGSELTSLTDLGGYYLNVYEDWVFYVIEEEGIFRMGTDGSDKTLLIDSEEAGHAHFLNLTDDWLYFQSGEAFKDYHRIRTDGTGYELLFWDFD